MDRPKSTEEEKGLLDERDEENTRRPVFRPRATGTQQTTLFGSTWFNAYFVIVHVLLLFNLIAVVYLSILASPADEPSTICE
jgi:hypothetical protein